jgi:hypothetical protein
VSYYGKELRVLEVEGDANFVFIDGAECYTLIFIQQWGLEFAVLYRHIFHTTLQSVLRSLMRILNAH